MSDLMTLVGQAKTKEELLAILTSEEWKKADGLSLGLTAQFMVIKANALDVAGLMERVATLEQKVLNYGMI